MRWAANRGFQLTAGAVMLTAMAALLGAPLWVVMVLLLTALAVLSWGAARQHAHTVAAKQEIEHAVRQLSESLGAPAIPHGLEDVARHLQVMADELAARLERAEEGARRAASHLAAFPEPVMIIDGAEILCACNEPAAELLEMPRERIVGRRSEEIFTRAELLHAIAQARRSGSAHLQIRFPMADGMRIWELAGARAGEDVVLALRDATEEARALEVKTDFVANASHELRTPIAALRTAVETLTSLQDETRADPAMQRRLIEMIAGNVARLEEMARDLLDLSRLESEEATLRPQPVGVSELAEELGTMFEPACRERKLTLTFELSPELEQLRTDRDLLHLILRNLLDNATRFAFEGTTVRVTGQSLLSSSGETPGMRFEVIDRGPGIPLAAQQRIFERYFQIDSARTTHRRGSGLGLAIVKHAVKRLGGTIRVHSVWQQGTTMIVELPGLKGMVDE